MGRIGAQAPLAFAAGLPLALSGATLGAWLKDAGTPIELIGLTALVGLPYNFKFVWAPLLDRYPIPLLDRRRGWMLVAQLALVAAIAALGTVEPTGSLRGLLQLAFAVALFSASQDIAVDAYRADVLAPQERGRGAAFYVTGYRVAMLVSGAFALWLAAYWSWEHVYWLMAAIMAVSAVATFLAPTPAVQGTPPPSLRAAVVEPLREFLKRRYALAGLAFVLLYKFGDALAGNLLTPFLMEEGFTKPEIAAIQKGVGLAATIVGPLAGGWLLDRMPLPRALLVFGALQAFANAGYLLIVATGRDLSVLTFAIIVDNLCIGLGTAAFVACLMALCDRRFSASQYALLTSASSLLGRLLGSGAGFVVASIGWSGLFVLSIVVGLPALLLVGMLPLRAEADPAEAEDGPGAGSAPAGCGQMPSHLPPAAPRLIR